MDAIRDDETEITGGLVIENGHATNDANLTRVWLLITEHLHKVGVADNGWEQLYQDPTDGRYWELWFPHGEMHGGGPPSLRIVPSEAARSKYGLGSEDY